MLRRLWESVDVVVWFGPGLVVGFCPSLPWTIRPYWCAEAGLVCFAVLGWIVEHQYSGKA